MTGSSITSEHSNQSFPYTVKDWGWLAEDENSHPYWRLLIRIAPAASNQQFPGGLYVICPPHQRPEVTLENSQWLEIQFEYVDDIAFAPVSTIPQIIPRDLFAIIETLCKSRSPEMLPRARAVIDILRSESRQDHNIEHQSFPEFAAYLMHNLGKDLRIPTIAEALGMRSSLFRQKCLECLGMTPLEYIKKVKFDTAKKLLIANEISIEEIAECIGYNDRSAFTHAFKSRTGLTPAQYRDRQS